MTLMQWRLLMAYFLLVASFSTFAADSIENRPLQFSKGASSAKVEGALKGNEVIDYKLRAKAGQTMSVTLQTSNLSNYFNVLPPGSNDEAVFIGSTSGNEWKGTLPTDGEYSIRVYLMRSAARRNEMASYELEVSIIGSATTAQGNAPASDARVGNTPYHATGLISCSMGSALEGSGQCNFGVIRGETGKAEVHVTPPGGFTRVLIFTGATVRADNDAALKAIKTGDMWSVDVNDYEHYQIPEAVISGG